MSRTSTLVVHMSMSDLRLTSTHHVMFEALQLQEVNHTLKRLKAQTLQVKTCGNLDLKTWEPREQ